jgi:hypothetical protein
MYLTFRRCDSAVLKHKYELLILLSVVGIVNA